MAIDVAEVQFQHVGPEAHPLLCIKAGTVEWLSTPHLETNHLVSHLGSSNYKLCDLGQFIHLARGQDTKDDEKIIAFKDSMRMKINPLMGSLK